MPVCWSISHLSRLNVEGCVGLYYIYIDDILEVIPGGSHERIQHWLACTAFVQIIFWGHACSKSLSGLHWRDISAGPSFTRGVLIGLSHICMCYIWQGFPADLNFTKMRWSAGTIFTCIKRSMVGLQHICRYYFFFTHTPASPMLQ